MAETSFDAVSGSLNSNIGQYSTQERIVGQFNGKDVYEKSYYGNGLNTRSVTLDNGTLFINDNAYAIVSWDGSIITTGNNIIPICFYASSSYYTQITTSSVGLRMDSTGYSIAGYFVTIRYIKS